METFTKFEDGNGNDLGKVWVCHNCGTKVRIEEIKLEKDELRFITCLNCHGRGVYVAG